MGMIHLVDYSYGCDLCANEGSHKCKKCVHRAVDGKVLKPTKFKKRKDIKMKAKLIVEGKEFPIEILDPELQKLLAPPKKTGYERVELYNTYYYDDCNGSVCNEIEEQHKCDNISYDGANYYSDKTVSENNARADKLMRQLRRFAVEHRSSTMARNECMYSISYHIFDNNVKLSPNKMINCHYMDIWFDTEDVAWQAINLFYNELIWYFTDYKDSL